MYKILTAIRSRLGRLARLWAAGEAPDDPLARMGPRDLADLPPHHPRCDPSAR